MPVSRFNRHSFVDDKADSKDLCNSPRITKFKFTNTNTKDLLAKNK